MILYLSSQKFGDNCNFLKEWIKEHNNKVLLIFNALDTKGKDKTIKIVEEDIILLEQIGFKVETVDLKEYFGRYEELKQKCKEFNAFCVIGGNMFVLRQAMRYSGFDEFLKEISGDDNYLYIGYSAGGCVLTKNMRIFEIVDEPINFYNKGEIIYDGIGLIKYTFIPHYKSGYHKAYLIDEVVNTCQKENIEYKALNDGEIIIERINGCDS